MTVKLKNCVRVLKLSCLRTKLCDGVTVPLSEVDKIGSK